jgi:CubicO group peptidase (beta-lactamase class C family)
VHHMNVRMIPKTTKEPFLRNLARLLILLLILILPGCGEGTREIPFEPYLWETTTPLDAGMDPQILDSAFTIASQKGYVDGLLVVRSGKIVAERYYNDFTQNSPHNIMSVSKSMLSAITGMALYGNYGLDPEDRMLDYFPEYDSDELDPRKNQITIKHLLTMRMGIEDESANDYGVYAGLYNSANWIRSTIEYPLVSGPGEQMRYNTFITHLLSGVITKATGQSTLEFAEEELFDPMGIDIDSWEQDPQGIYFGGNSMHVTPREMAVLGLLYLHRGALHGKQIVPEEWVEYSLQPSTDFSHPNNWGTWKNYNYACLWWLGQFNGNDSFMGYGYGGQFVIVFPGLELIVVSTCKNNVPPEATNEQEWAVFELVTRYILPSLS